MPGRGFDVPQGSVLGPSLWNILHDDVLNLDLVDATTIAFAVDLIVVAASSEFSLMAKTNRSLKQISEWMSDHKLILALENIEAIIVKGGRTREHVNVILSDTRLSFKIKKIFGSGEGGKNHLGSARGCRYD